MKERIRSLMLVLICYIIILIFVTYLYDKLPILIDFPILKNDSFYKSFISNMYNSVLDFFLFSVIIFIILGKHDKQDKIDQYHNNIDDCRYWFSEQSNYINAANIRRLQELDHYCYKLAKSSLENCKLKYMKFEHTEFMGASFNNSNFKDTIFNFCNFRGASFESCSANSTKFTDCNLKYLKMNNSNFTGAVFKNTKLIKAELKNAIFKSAIFNNCDFENADLTGASFENANLKNVINLTADQLRLCSNIKFAKLADNLARELNPTN